MIEFVIRRTVALWALSLAFACLPAGHGVSVPEEAELAFVCRLSSRQVVVGCERLELGTASSRAQPADESWVIVSFSRDALDRIGIDDPKAPITIERSSSDLDTSAICRQHGHLHVDQLERPLEDLDGDFETFAFADEPQLRSITPPNDLSNWSLFHPIRPCNEGRQVVLEPFVDANAIGLGAGLISGLLPLGDNELLFSDDRSISRLRRGRPGELVWRSELQLSPPLSEPGVPPGGVAAYPYEWRIFGIGLEPGNGPTRRGIVVVNEYVRTPGGAANFGKTAIVELIVNEQGASVGRKILELPNTTPKSDLRSVAMDEHGGYVVVGHALVVTSTSIDAMPNPVAVDRLLGETITITDDLRYPHIIGAQAGAVALGDASLGWTELEIAEPFGPLSEAIRAVDWRRADDGGLRVIVASSGAKVVEWTAGDDTFLERPIWLPEEARECADAGKLECGRLRLSNEVELISGVDDSSSDEVLIPPDSCNTLLLVDRRNACTNATAYQDGIQRLPQNHARVLRRTKDGWIFATLVDDAQGEILIADLRVGP